MSAGIDKMQNMECWFFFSVKCVKYLNLLSDIMGWYWETH